MLINFKAISGNAIKSKLIEPDFITLLILAIAWMLFAIFMYIFLSSQQLIGWDTAAYSYYSGVLKLQGLSSFLEKTYYGSNGVLFYFLMVFIQNSIGHSLFIIDKLLTSIFFGGLMIGSSVIVHSWIKKSSFTLMALVFSILWAGPYVLASNLHSNGLGLMIGLFAMSLIPKAILEGKKYLIFTLILLFFSSLAHPQTGAYLALMLGCLMLVLVCFHKTNRARIIFRFCLMLIVSTSLMLYSAFMFGQARVLGPIITPSQSLEAQQSHIDLVWAIKLMGHNLFPIVLLSLFVLALVLIKKTLFKSASELRIGLLLTLIWATSTLFFWILSYSFNVFITYAQRMLTLFPLPLILTFGIFYLLKIRVKR